MCDRAALTASIATTIVDYQAQNRVFQIDANHVERWVAQFQAADQLAILAEMDHVLKNTYLSRALHELHTGNILPHFGDANFWRTANFLRLQPANSSQDVSLAILDKKMQQAHGFSIDECGGAGGTYFYIDDAAYTGNQIRWSIQRWLDDNPNLSVSNINIVTIRCHSHGRWYTLQQLNRRYSARAVQFRWFFHRILEDRKVLIDTSEVLRPTAIPDNPDVLQYVQFLSDAGYPPDLRTPDRMGANKVFSSETGRAVLEQNL